MGRQDVTVVHRGVSAGPVGLARGVVLTGLAIGEALLVLWLCLVLCLACVGVGVPLLPGALRAVRAQARRQRRLARAWSGVRVDDPYRPVSAELARAGGWAETRRRLADPATRRDAVWLLVNPFVGPLMAFLPLVAVVHGLFGVVLAFAWRPITSAWNGVWFDFIPVNGQTTATMAAALGVVQALCGLLLFPRWLMPLHGRWVRFVLGRSRGELNDRVEQLQTSRSDAVDLQAAELRRIERDLHDGTQARLVALGMTLTTAEALLEHNPEAVRALLAEAKGNSTRALNELRDLVHGVHPPLLADRGLVDAVRTFALELPLPVQVTGEIPGRLPAPVESAAYFAIAELLGNVVKHAEAGQVSVDFRYEHRVLRAAVHDNGVGGADAADGGGIRGIERRLAAFDGTLALTSPPGGGTTAALEIGCDLLDGSDATGDAPLPR
ncbi:sensor domain-containing protein [Streptomyces olivaceus]|uniref:sensor histidine kinase n=1 Tax=Streptomyces TaxID=1883 RepID=UPI001FB768AF|nr:sensor domain-containing protein [Streptomyces sp. CB09030]UOG78717.1 sensor domain-containing protein [Streptomyces sp. CB09030]